MLCISPLNIPRPNGLGNKDRILVPCGKCVACLVNRREDWTIRLKEELKNATSAYFVTLTYNDDNLIYTDNYATIDKTDLQKFFKRLRKNSKQFNIRYYAVGEYGTQTQRPHYHIIMFNLIDVEQIPKAWKTKQGKEIGHVQIGQVNGASIHYVTKYHVNKTDYPEGTEKPFALMSKRPALGSCYIKNYREYHEGYPQRAFYNEIGGIKKRLPRFLKEKLYSKEDLKTIANENVRNATITSEQAELDYKNLNGSENYFKYLVTKKQELNRTYKQKINKKNTF